MVRKSREKLYALDAILREGGDHKAKEIARRLGVDERTVIRHVQALREEGAPVASGKDGYRYTRKFSLRQEPPTERDLFGLTLALAVLQQYRNNSLVELLERRIREYLDRVAPDGSLTPEEVARYVSFYVGGSPARELDVLDSLLEWTMARRQLRIRYRSKGKKEPKERLVDPYGLSNRGGIWYLVAFDHEHGKFIPFAVSRIEKATPGERFERDPDFDLHSYFGSTFFVMKGEKPEKVAIRFWGEAADLVRDRQFHPSQKIRERPDGSIDFEVTVDGPEDLLYFALDHGDKAEILEPRSLREKMAGIVGRMGAIYRRG